MKDQNSKPATTNHVWPPHVFEGANDAFTDSLMCTRCGYSLLSPIHETDPEFQRLFALLRETLDPETQEAPAE